MDLCPFRLRDLPYLARKNVLQQMTFGSLFYLSLCSKRMKSMIKKEHCAHAFNLDVHISKEFSFVINYPEDQNLQDQFDFRNELDYESDEENSCRPLCELSFSHFETASDEDNRVLTTYWKEHFTAAQSFYKELQDLFSLRMDTVILELYDIEEDIKEIVQWVNSMTPETLNCEGWDYCFDTYIWIMENIHAKKVAAFYVKPTEYTERETVQVNVGTLIIEFSQWVKLNHIQSMNCSVVELLSCLLTDKEINVFIRNLKAGFNPNLKRILFEFDREPDMHVIAQGFELSPENNTFKFELDNGVTWRVTAITVEEERNGLEVKIEDIN